MEYCEGGDLFSLIAKQRGKHLHEELILFIFLQLCLAVNYIHGRHILHRDIKTQNIFITKGFIIKLGDFGIARRWKDVCIRNNDLPIIGAIFTQQKFKRIINEIKIFRSFGYVSTFSCLTNQRLGDWHLKKFYKDFGWNL